jgi:hypothetical protein
MARGSKYTQYFAYATLLVGLLILLYSTKVRTPVRTRVSPCCNTASKNKIEDFCHLDVIVPEFLKENCSCRDYMLCKLVVVTALSSNHFRESQDFFGSVLSKLPNSKVIVYDLGLTWTQVNIIQSYCNVLEVRKFDFARYPPHTKNLFTYAWKPFIIKEVSEEYELLFYCDASCRIKNTFTTYITRLIKFPLLPATWLHHSVVRTTHDGMLKYLTPHLTRAWMVEVLPNGIQATGFLLLVNQILKERILTPWVDCAEHVDCIAPQGAKLWPCNFNRLPNTSYVGCHRFDQSALNLILIRELGLSFQNAVNDHVSLVNVLRHITADYNNQESRDCGIKYCRFAIMTYICI